MGHWSIKEHGPKMADPSHLTNQISESFFCKDEGLKEAQRGWRAKLTCTGGKWIAYPLTLWSALGQSWWLTSFSPWKVAVRQQVPGSATSSWWRVWGKGGLASVQLCCLEVVEIKLYSYVVMLHLWNGLGHELEMDKITVYQMVPQSSNGSNSLLTQTYFCWFFL